MALVSARPNDPDHATRQQLYLRALRTVPGVSIYLGHFLSHEVRMALAVCPGQRQQYVRVIKTEEKGSDVNLATHLLHDAHMGRFEVAVVVSNDSDLLEPIKIVREQLGKKVGILNPQKTKPRPASAYRLHQARFAAAGLGASQLPAMLTDATGTFTKHIFSECVPQRCDRFSRHRCRMGGATFSFFAAGLNSTRICVGLHYAAKEFDSLPRSHDLGRIRV
jgi:hypothetical protein